MIFSSPPRNWKELQSFVCEIFNECGYHAESPKTINSARSESIEVDVYAEVEGIPKQIIICECKHWNRKVSQSVVHAFRMQISDIGANTGLIITKKGYQPGAIASARFTNTTLLTWDEFESMYEPVWFNRSFLKCLNNQMCRAFIEYTEPINSRIISKADALSEDKRLHFAELREKHLAMSCLLSYINVAGGIYELIYSGHDEMLKLPLSINKKLFRYEMIPNTIIEAVAYKKLLKEIEAYVITAIDEFDDIFGERA